MISKFAVWLLVSSSLVSAQTLVCGKPRANEVALSPSTIYSGQSAGFDLATAPEIVGREGCSSNKSIFVSFPVGEGNYTVTVELGGSFTAVTTVRAEARRLMVDRLPTKAGHSRTMTFQVAVRRPEIAGTSQKVKRKPREMRSLSWDEKLTLEFAGNHPSFKRITVKPSNAISPVVYLAGDSTVVDQDNEPWAAWGQMLPAFFGQESPLPTMPSRARPFAASSRN